MNTPISRLAAGLLLTAVLAACTTQGSVDATATPSLAASSASSAAEPGRVSADTASREELVAALTAAGVPNADRWATEVMEYRPYATDDPTLQKLQDNLAKYDPDAATLAAILSALQP
jgi:hypothetical protein